MAPRSKPPNPQVPRSLHSALITVFWKSRYRVPLIIGASLLSGLFIFWKSLPDTTRSGLMTWAGIQIGPHADLRIVLKTLGSDTNAHVVSSRIGQAVARAFIG